MPNEEIAKDLTVALIARMTDPTPVKILEAYHEILQGLGRLTGTITLESIEKHLQKQDYQNPVITGLVFGASLVIAGSAIAISAALQSNINIEIIRAWSWEITGLGVAICVVGFIALIRKRF